MDKERRYSAVIGDGKANQAERGVRRCRLIVCWAAAVAVLVFLTASAAASVQASPHVHLRPGVDARFVDVDQVLEQLLTTLDTPSLWGGFWDQRVPASGAIKSLHPFPYKFSDIAAALKRYLTDGKLNIAYRTALLKSGAALTVSRTEVILYEPAGRNENGGRYVYGDYNLARTIFHELMHVFQYDYWTVAGRSSDYEGFPTATEPKLPKAHFNTCEYLDTGGQAPMPPPSADPKSCQARYDVTVYRGAEKDTSTWTFKTDGNALTGTSKWTCCPGPRVDGLRGTIKHNEVEINRECGGQGAPAACKQAFQARWQEMSTEPGRARSPRPGTTPGGWSPLPALRFIQP
jgi:hypothetical protein